MQSYLDQVCPQGLVLDAKWLNTLLSEKNVRKPKAKWTLSDLAVHGLAADIAIRAQRQRNPPPPPHPTMMAPFVESDSHSAALVVCEGLEARREAVRFQLVELERIGSEQQIELWNSQKKPDRGGHTTPGGSVSETLSTFRIAGTFRSDKPAAPHCR